MKVSTGAFPPCISPGAPANSIWTDHFRTALPTDRPFSRRQQPTPPAQPRPTSHHSQHRSTQPKYAKTKPNPTFPIPNAIDSPWTDRIIASVMDHSSGSYLMDSAGYLSSQVQSATQMDYNYCERVWHVESEDQDNGYKRDTVSRESAVDTRIANQLTASKSSCPSSSVPPCLDKINSSWKKSRNQGGRIFSLFELVIGWK